MVRGAFDGVESRGDGDFVVRLDAAVPVGGTGPADAGRAVTARGRGVLERLVTDRDAPAGSDLAPEQVAVRYRGCGSALGRAAITSPVRMTGR